MVVSQRFSDISRGHAKYIFISERPLSLSGADAFAVEIRIELLKIVPWENPIGTIFGVARGRGVCAVLGDEADLLFGLTVTGHRAHQMWSAADENLAVTEIPTNLL